MLGEHVKSGNMAAIRRLISPPQAQYTSLTMLDSEEDYEYNILHAYILRIKKFEREVQVKYKGAWGSTKGAKYDRMILLMEVKENRAFYVLCDRNVQFSTIFMIRNERWIGRKVTIYEPMIRKEMYGLPIVETFDPFIPINNELNLYEPIFPIPSDVLNLAVYPFQVTAYEIQLVQCKFVKACGSLCCDGQHGPESACPTLYHAPLSNVMSCSLSIPTDRIHKIQFTSTTFSKLFFTESCLRCGLPEKDVREVVKNAMVAAKLQRIAFHVIGYVAYNIGENDLGVSERARKIVSVTPIGTFDFQPRGVVNETLAKDDRLVDVKQEEALSFANVVPTSIVANLPRVADVLPRGLQRDAGVARPAVGNVSDREAEADVGAQIGDLVDITGEGNSSHPVAEKWAEAQVNPWIKPQAYFRELFTYIIFCNICLLFLIL